MSSLPFFPSPVSAGLDLKAPDTWTCTPCMNRRNSRERCFLVWGAGKTSPKGQRGWEKFQGFFFSLLSVPAPRQSYTGGSSGPVAAVAQWQQGRHLKLKEENPFLLSNGAVILRTWSKFHCCCFLHCLPCCLALDADAVSVVEWGKLKPTNTRLVQYLKISQCNLPY